jgi:alpha-glucosidase
MPFSDGGAWWRDAVIYQIYPRSFADSSGSGVGDLAGITQRLDHVAALGADAIWISPFVASPQRDFGYDVSDYCAVDPLFGTLEDVDALIARAHALGLRVLMDQVWPHTSDQHPWFSESRSAARGAKADWYVWADPRPDGTPPNNWLSVFGGPAWSWEAQRRQYYLHHFLAEQPALNLRNPAVLKALAEVAAFWIARGVDGFRIDAVDFMAHALSLADNPPRQDAFNRGKPYSYQQHLCDLAAEDTPQILSHLRQQMPSTLWQNEPPVTVVEVGSEPCRLPPLARAGAYTSPLEGGASPTDMAYSLAMMKPAGDAASLADLIARAEQQAAGGWLLWAFSNHDVARVVSRWGGGDGASAGVYMALLLSLRGAVCLYQGEELGLPEADLARAALRDPVGIALWPDAPGRDGCRTPMPWVADAPQAGFSPPEAREQPWLPLPEAHRPLAVDRQQGDPASPLAASRALIAWRKCHPALRWGSLEDLTVLGSVLSFRRRLLGTSVHLCFNLSATPAPVPALASGRVWQPVPLVAGWHEQGSCDQLASWGTLMCICEDSL